MSGKVQIWPDFGYERGSLSREHKLHYRVASALGQGGCPFAIPYLPVGGLEIEAV